MRPAGAAALAALFLTGCASTLPARNPFDQLPGWAEEDHAAALRAYQALCGVAQDDASMAACQAARTLGPAGETAARAFFERRFRPEAIAGEGLLTAYFAPEYPARRKPGGEFTAPVLAPPADSRAARRGRAEIEASPPGEALAWMRPENLFFLQIQGSGALVFGDGGRAKALYAGDNGRPYFAVGKVLVQNGALARNGVTADAIQAWLAKHRGPEAQAVMDLNPRYTFFRLAPDDGREPAGGAGAPLVAGRTLAVDAMQHRYGELLWIDADRPSLAGASPQYRRLAVAADTGSAIKGPVRADLYLGRGETASAEAGRVRHRLRLVRLAPRGEGGPR